MLEAIKTIAGAAEEAAVQLGINVVVSVVDTHGNQVQIGRASC